jgi:hypothetical protein
MSLAVLVVVYELELAINLVTDKNMNCALIVVVYELELAINLVTDKKSVLCHVSAQRKM